MLKCPAEQGRVAEWRQQGLSVFFILGRQVWCEKPGVKAASILVLSALGAFPVLPKQLFTEGELVVWFWGFFSWPFIPWWNTILQQEWSQPSKGSSWHHPGTLEPSLGLCCDIQGLPNMARQAVYCLGEEQKPKWNILNPSKIMVELL